MDRRFFFVGAPKAATTSIYRCLDQHPEICTSRPKEPGFFGTGLYREDREHYERRYFGHRAGEPVAGEASTPSLYLPHVPARIRELYPEARILVSVREPVARAYSNWWMYYSRLESFETLSFEEAVADELGAIEEDGPRLEDEAYWKAIREVERGGDAAARSELDRTYLRRGYYARHLERYLSHFDADRVQVVFFERFVEDPVSVAREIYRFLGVDDDFVPRETSSRHRSFNSKLVRQMVDLAKRLRLPDLLPDRVDDLYGETLRPRLRTIGSKPGMDPELRRSLMDHFRDRNRALDDLLSTDLSALWPPEALEPAADR